jgi:Ca-activated chloride channel family protein
MRKQLTIAAAVAVVAATIASAPASAVPADRAAPADPPAAAPAVAADDAGRMMLVMDSSGSMKEPAAGGVTKIEAARSALDTVIDELPDDADVGMRVFGAEVFSRRDPGACQDTQVVVAPGTDNRDDLRAAVDDYEPYGETPIPAALKAAARDLGTEGKRSIVLVSDGESTCAPNPCRVAAQIASQGIDLQIDVVGLSVSSKAREQLRCIAEEGNGSYHDAEDAGDLADSLRRIAERAVRPFAVHGTPVSGTSTSTDAPTIGAGRYVDTMPAEGEGIYYELERTIPGSTLWAGVAAQPGVNQNQLKLVFSTPDGQECGFGSGHNDITGGGDRSLVLGGAATTSVGTFAEECSAPDRMILRVEKTEWSDGGRAAPMQLTVIEEPPVTDLSALPESSDGEEPWEPMETSGTPVETVAGSTFLDAPELDEETAYRSTIVPGEVQFYRVPAAWGERLQVELRAHADTDVADAYGVLPPVINVRVVSPVDGRADSTLAEGPDGGVVSNHVFASGTEERVAHAATRTIRYLNRDSYVDNSLHTALAGDYYVMVDMDSAADGDSVMVPYDLSVATAGDAGEGAPDYAEDGDIQVGPTEEPDPAEAGDEETSANRAASGDDGAASDGNGDTVRLAAGVGAASLGGVAVLAAAFLLLRRRRH